MNFKIIGYTNYQLYTLALFISIMIITGLLILGSIIVVFLHSQQITNLDPSMQNKLIQDIMFAGTIALIACAIIGTVMVIRYTNTVAGPLYRLKLYLYNMLDGKPQGPLRFRSNDNFKDLTLAVNSFQEKINTIELQQKN
ncbi:MAG: hypothetical protein GF384_07580 [Elusimicrobia bacterium]|nr:hypothetical protein [Elusimicrobiota bacterium]